MNEINLKEISEEVAFDLGMDDEVVKNVLRQGFNAIARGLASEQKRVELHDIRTFRLKLRKARAGVTPAGVPWSENSRYKVTFKAAPQFAAAIAKLTEKEVF